MRAVWSRQKRNGCSFVILAKARTERLCPRLVIPAKAGIHLDLDFASRVYRCVEVLRAPSMACFVRLQAPESLSLEWPRESNQREGHPGAAPFGHPCPKGA